MDFLYGCYQIFGKEGFHFTILIGTDLPQFSFYATFMIGRNAEVLS